MDNKKQSVIGEHFQQKLTFAHSEKIGDKRIIPMQSGNIYLSELVEIENPYNHGADDTALRDLIWKVLDIVEVKDDFQSGGKIITCPLFGSIAISNEMIMQDAHRDIWKIANDIFIKKFFPEQNKGFRFLRG